MSHEANYPRALPATPIDRTPESIERLQLEVERLAARPAISFVDCGYVRRTIANVTDQSERDIRLNVRRMTNQVAQVRYLRLLRSYLYDGAFPAGHERHDEQQAEHERLADQPGVQLRLGTVRGDPPRQKGVDTLLVLDMLTMAQRGAYDTAVLWAGDADFTEVVDQVQRLGRQVALVIAPGGSVANELRRTADVILEMTPAWWKTAQHR